MTGAASETIAIERATTADVDALTTVMIEAFLLSPDCVWLIPDVSARRRVFGRLVPRLLHLAVTAGSVDTTAGRDAAAVWWNHADIEDAYARIVTETCHPHIPAFYQLAGLLAEAFARIGATEQPQTLAYLGVLPAHQLRGRGTALLRHRHEQLDAAGTPAYLVATTPASRDLYRRHGYHVVPDGPIWLPDTGPQLWPMWRDPRPASPGGHP